MKITHKYFYHLLIFFIPLILVTIWFWNGNVYGGGESGLYFYDIGRISNITRFTWADPAIGNLVGVGVSGHPLHFALSLVESVGVPNFIIQAVFFYLLFVISGFSIFYFSKAVSLKVDNKSAFLGAIFYWFNPISLINVWNRNLDNYRVFFALLPLFTFLYFLGIKRKKYYFLFLSVLATTIFSYALSATPLHMLLFTVIFAISGFYIFISKNVKERVFIFKYTLLTIFLYVFVNYWWLSQFFRFIFSSNFEVAVTSFFSTSSNLMTLSILSEKLGNMSDIMRLVHGTFFKGDLSWSVVYSNQISIFLGFVVVAPAFFGIYKYYKNKNVLFLGIMFILCFFLLKGDAPPMGEIFRYVFNKVIFLQVFRNPFEKFGFLLIVFASPLLAVGVSHFNNLRKVGKYLFLTYTLLFFLFLGLPYWTKLVFTRVDPNNKHNILSTESRVPAYYKEADEWIRGRSSGRILVLPLGGEGIDYTWDTPYAGVELSSTLFTNPSISFSTTIPFYEDIVNNIEKLILTESGAKELFSVLNIDYIVLRRDIEWRLRQMRDPDFIEKTLDSLSYLTKEEKFGELVIYSITNESTRPHIYASNTSLLVLPRGSSMDFVKESGKAGEVMVSNNSYSEFTRSITIKETSSAIVSPKTTLDVEEVEAQLLYVNHLPGTPGYILSVLKEKLERTTVEAQVDRFVFDITRLGKRAVEVSKLSKENDTASFAWSVQNYKNTLAALEKENKGSFISNSSNPYLGIVSSELSKHLTLFEYATKNSNQEIAKLSHKLAEHLALKMKDYGMLTENTILLPLSTKNGMYLMHKFEVPEESEYEIVIDYNNWDLYFEGFGEKYAYQIDDRLVSVRPNIDGKKVSLGKHKFSEGIHEIIMNMPKAINLVSAPTEEKMVYSSTNNGSWELPILNFDPFAAYRVTFDHFIEKGRSFKVFFNQNNDPKEENALTNHNVRVVSRDGYEGGYRQASFDFTPKNGATTASIEFLVEPFNNCPVEKKRIFLFPSCEDKDYRRQFNKSGKVAFKNLRVEKIYDSKLYLKKENYTQKLALPDISFTKINPTFYSVEVKNARNPYILAFSELYNPGWELFIESIPLALGEHFLINAYANGWYVDKMGDYNMIVKFSAQDGFERAKMISVFGILFICLTLIYLIYVEKKKTN